MGTVSNVTTNWDPWPQISLNLFPQITISGHRFESVPTNYNLWTQIRICSHTLQIMTTHSNLFPYITICGHILEFVPTYCNLWWQIRIQGNCFESVPTASNCSHRLQHVVTYTNIWPQIQSIFSSNRSQTLFSLKCQQTWGFQSVFVLERSIVGRGYPV